MSSSEAAPATGSEQARARAREIWALGDYDRVARDVLAPFGPALVHACRVGPGVRVLDVAAGTGNVALAAARAGASVTGCDLTPALLEVARRNAAEEGLDVAWIEADAEALPFPDASFDVVTSAVGVMFAPDHTAAARELLRVCRPGGTIGLIAWTPGGWSARFFETISRHLPPAPADAGASPMLWGDDAHVLALLGDGIEGLDATREPLVVDHFASAEELAGWYGRVFGPVVAARAAIGDPARIAAMDRDLVAFFAETAKPGPVWHYDYLLAVARRSGS